MIQYETLLFVAVAVLLAPRAVAGQFSVTESVEAARVFLLTAYPELRGRQVSGQMISQAFPLENSWSGGARLGFRLFEQPPDNLAKLEPLLSTEFVFATDGSIREFSSQGALVNTERFEAIAAQVNAHARWSDTEVLEYLTRAGAAFIPTDQAAMKLAFESRAQLLGPVLGLFDVKSVQFELRDEDPLKSRPPVALLYWLVEIEKRARGTGRQRYTLEYEPFEGKLVRITIRG